MSSKGIYTALSGAIAQSEKLDTIANNIANSNTASFKKDTQTFYEYLTANEKEPQIMKVPRVPASIESFYDMQGGDRGYVDSAGTYTDFTQGHLKKTGNPFDTAINGKGFFEVLTKRGVRYTRNGRFKINQDKELVNSLGHHILSSDRNKPTEERIIKLGDRPFYIGYDGTISLNNDTNEKIGQISMVDITRLDGLKKIANHYYEPKPNWIVEVEPAKESQLFQGFVESSNVNVIHEMTDMIQTTRNFEATQKAIKAYDQMSAKLVNDVPKTY